MRLKVNREDHGLLPLVSYTVEVRAESQEGKVGQKTEDTIFLRKSQIVLDVELLANESQIQCMHITDSVCGCSFQYSVKMTWYKNLRFDYLA